MTMLGGLLQLFLVMVKKKGSDHFFLYGSMSEAVIEFNKYI